MREWSMESSNGAKAARPPGSLERQEEARLTRLWRDRADQDARGRLVEAYRPLIRSLARRFVRPGLDIEDLESEGTIGFLSCLDHFDPDLGYSVATLARFHIVARLQVHASEFSGQIRLPKSRKMRDVITGALARLREQESALGRKLTDEDRLRVCEEFGLSLSDLEKYEMVMRPGVDVHEAASARWRLMTSPLSSRSLHVSWRPSFLRGRSPFW